VLCETSWQRKNGWPGELQACKGEEKEMWLDQDKRENSKAKEGRFVVLCMVFVVDCIKSLLK
jgi:hypothetical protein